MMTPLPTSRKAAIAQKSIRYFTGKPCGRGRIAYRWTAGHCSVCHNLAKRTDEQLEPIPGRPNAPKPWANTSEAIQARSIPEPNSGCWIWLLASDVLGYGYYSVGKTSYRAHRLSYEIHKGQIPAGMVVKHDCDNPSCVNPDHLSVGSQHSNIADCIRRGRNTRGEKVITALLSEKDVVEIRRAYDAGETQISIARRYPAVGRRAVSGAASRATWKHVP